MGVKVIQCLFFLLGFLFFPGTFAKEMEDESRKLYSLRITKAEKAIQTETLIVREFENEPLIHKREQPRSPSPHRMLYTRTELKPLNTMPKMDIDTPITTVPVINPTSPVTMTPTATTPTFNPTPPTFNPTPTTPYNPTPTTTPVTNPYTTPTPTTGTPTPTMGTPTTGTPTPTLGNPTPSSSGQSWCIASQSASQTALQVALDYACGYGGADCSAIQTGGSCFNPDTVRDHASYAFNDYYQKNPAPTSCDFGGTAMITNTDPSTSTCQFPSTSTSSSVLNTTNPTGSTVYGSSPPFSTNDSPPISRSMPVFITMICLLISLAYLDDYK